MTLLTVNPFDNVGLSALLQQYLLFYFIMLNRFKMKGIYAALTTLVVTLIVALFVFELPARISRCDYRRRCCRYFPNRIYRFNGSLVI